MANIICGGWSETMNAGTDTQSITNEVRSLVEGKTNKVYQEYRAIKYSTQLVAGTNYLIKVCVGGPNHIHLLLFQALPCNGGYLQLRAVEVDKTLNDPLEPFYN